MKRQKSVNTLTESRRIHGHHFHLTIQKDFSISPIEFSMHTTINKTWAISTFKECLTWYETREHYYTDLRMAMTISYSWFLLMWTIPVPALSENNLSIPMMVKSEEEIHS
jgi:hypothetical protein